MQQSTVVSFRTIDNMAAPRLLLVLIFGVVAQRVVADGDVVLDMRGFVPPVYSPFDEEGNLNLAIVPRYARFMKEYGMDGVLVAGTAGECDKLTVKEKKSLFEAWLRAAKPLGLKVMVQVGAIPLPDARELARFAERIGVDAILSLPELYYKPDTVTKLIFFLQCIASAAPNTPLLYYDLPSYTNVRVNMVQFYEQAKAKIPSFKGIKTGDLNVALQLRPRLKGDERVFVANSDNIAPAALMGFEDFIMEEFSIFPDLMKRIVGDSENCQLRETRRYYERLQDYKNTIESQGRSGYPAYKPTMTLVTGINVGDVREPEIPLTERQKRELEASLRRKRIQLRGCAEEYNQ